MEPAEFQIRILQQSKCQQQQELEHSLEVELLRVQSSAKKNLCAEYSHMSTPKILRFIREYELLPSAPFRLHDLFSSPSASLLRSDCLYFGETKDQVLHGRGVLVTGDSVYEGYFYQGRRHREGAEVDRHGNLFVGGFRSGGKHGHGVMYWFSKADKYNQRPLEYYNGEWLRGLPHGQGFWQNSNGDQYRGNFKNGLKHGIGQQYFANGDSYIGPYVNGMLEGVGTYSCADGSCYEGEFKQGLRHGYGKWRGGSSEWAETYEGNYSQGRKSGDGVYSWGNGWAYKGHFSKDLREGYGELFYFQQCRYEGLWSKGLKKQEMKAKASKLFKQCRPCAEDYNSQPAAAKQKGRSQSVSNFQLLRRPTNSNSIRPAKERPEGKRSRPDQWAKTCRARVGTQIQRPLSKTRLVSKNMAVSCSSRNAGRLGSAIFN